MVRGPNFVAHIDILVDRPDLDGHDSPRKIDFTQELSQFC